MRAEAAKTISPSQAAYLNACLWTALGHDGVWDCLLNPLSISLPPHFSIRDTLKEEASPTLIPSPFCSLSLPLLFTFKG